MKSNYWRIVITYIVMQFSSLIGVPIMVKTGLYDDTVTASIHWTIFSFFLACLLTIFFLRDDIRNRHLVRNRVSVPAAIFWSIGGVFLSLFAQIIASLIETNIFNITEQSANTANILEIASQMPLFIIVVSVLGPFLEEIVFRYILFSSLYHRFNFFTGALISSFIFALVHVDFPHLLVYTSMGFVFSFLYVKTKRIMVPILAHTLMNTFVVIVNLYLVPMLGDLEPIEGFIGGFIL